MQLTRRATLITAAASGLLARVPAMAKAPELNFVVVGDWGREGADKQGEVAVAMGHAAEQIRSQFVISVGDNFYEDGVASVDDRQWRTSFEDIYTAKSLQTRWDVILGNHDYRGSVAAQLDYGKRSPRWNMPARYFQRLEKLPDGTQIAFFYIDTNPMLRKYWGTKVRVDGQDVDAQLAWLDTALGQSRAAWNVVVGHHPIHTVSDGERDSVDLVIRLKPLLQKHNIHLYINGHVHNLQYLAQDGMHYITCGAGSQVYSPGPARAGQFASGHHGFMTMQIDAGRIGWRSIDERGTVLYDGMIRA
jgi:acid phosphatase